MGLEKRNLIMNIPNWLKPSIWLKAVDRLQRIIATGSCFALFGLGGVFLSITIFPLQQLFIRDINKQKRTARTTVHYSFKLFVTALQWTRVCKVKAQDIEQFSQLKGIKGKIIIANHPSLVDIVVLISLIKNADCVVKGHLFKNPFTRGVVRASGYLNNSEPEKLLEDCSASLAQGNNIIIFPEGTRTDPNSNTPLKLQRGFANIALRCQADLMIILLSVNPSTLTKGNVWYNVPSRTFDFCMQVKNTIEINHYRESFADNTSKAVRQLTRDIESQFKTAL
ncbi:MAG: 1-acyl-sn-glycerol-3-phosphate acyltransferase [Phenylobacterium sp.]|jgi:1-acyl-sn-glycerol-3-phosphate acyltransferase